MTGYRREQQSYVRRAEETREGMADMGSEEGEDDNWRKKTRVEVEQTIR